MVKATKTGTASLLEMELKLAQTAYCARSIGMQVRAACVRGGVQGCTGRAPHGAGALPPQLQSFAAGQQCS